MTQDQATTAELLISALETYIWELEDVLYGSSTRMRYNAEKHETAKKTLKQLRSGRFYLVSE